LTIHTSQNLSLSIQHKKFIDALERFKFNKIYMHDPKTEGIVFIREIGGDAEDTVIFLI
jgi:succinyl-CoA synthetase alpha subunit